MREALPTWAQQRALEEYRYGQRNSLDTAGPGETINPTPKMKQLEIDAKIDMWFAAQDRLQTAMREKNSAETHLENLKNAIARELLPTGAKPGEIYIFPTSGGRAVRVFLKERTGYSVGDGESVHKSVVAVVEPHEFRCKQ